jgi:hypothetical protein
MSKIEKSKKVSKKTLVLEVSEHNALNFIFYTIFIVTIKKLFWKVKSLKFFC